jgi:hypothetical protein
MNSLSLSYPLRFGCCVESTLGGGLNATIQMCLLKCYKYGLQCLCSCYIHWKYAMIPHTQGVMQTYFWDPSVDTTSLMPKPEDKRRPSHSSPLPVLTEGRDQCPKLCSQEDLLGTLAANCQLALHFTERLNCM